MDQENLDYLKPENRLSNELACTIGCDPATNVSWAGCTAAACASEIAGFNGGRAAACLTSGFEVLEAEALGRDGGS